MGILEEKARIWRRERSLTLLWESLSRLVCGGVLALTALLWADALLLPGRGSREAILAAAAAAAAAGLAWALSAPWRRHDWAEVLEGAAGAFPSLRQYARGAWDLRRGPAAHTSERLAAAHLERTEALLAALPPRRVFRWRPSRTLRVLAACALAGAATWPWLGRTGWERVLLPWRDVSLERFVVLEPGDAVWTLGQPATLTARLAAAGGPAAPGEVRLWIKAGGGWKAVDWDRRGAQRAAFSIASVVEPISYRATWRGTVTRSYRLEPRPLPRLESLRAAVAGEPRPTALCAGETLRARRGTWVVLSGRPNQELARAALRASFLPGPLPLRCEPGGECQARFLARQDGTFEFDLEAADGRRDPAPAVYAFSAAADEPPTVELLSPQAPLQASPSAALPVAYAARDDSGLTRSALIVRAPGRAQRELVMRTFAAAGLKEHIGDYSWELGGLPPGGKVEFQVQVWDDASPPQTALSQVNTVEIVDFEAGHKETRRLWSAAEAALEGLAGREESVRELFRSGRGQQGKAEADGLTSAWKETVDSVEALARAMSSDLYANPGLAEQFSMMSEDLKRARDNELPAARAAQERGDLAAAAVRHGALAGRLRRAGRSLERARSLQSLQDFHNQAGDLGRDGERLAAALEAMDKGRPGGGAQALRQLESALERLRRGMEELSAAISALPAPEPGEQAQGRRAYSMPLLAAQTSADALRAALRAGDLSGAAQIARELARQLAAVQAAVQAAAASGARAAASGRAAQRLSGLQRLWAKVAEEQGRLVEGGQALETERLERFLAGQRDFLAELAARESVLIDSAAAGGAPPQAVSAMRAAQAEFAAGQVRRAPELCAAAAAALRGAGRAGLAEAQDALALELAQAPSAPGPGAPDARTAAASRRQAELRLKTAGLQGELESFMDDSGALLSEAVDKVASAQTEQGAAEAALDRGDTAEALARQQKALALLEAGGQRLQSSAAAGESIQLGIDGGFARPAPGGVRPSAGGAAGARLEFVPLPSAEDYQPAREMRRELERSMRERRPRSLDGVIKEYFKRLSQ